MPSSAPSSSRPAARTQPAQPAQPAQTAQTAAVPASRRPATLSFLDLGVPEMLIAPLVEAGAVSPFPIQTATLPDSLAGRDVLGRGETGSGKTLAFAVPLVARLAVSRSAGRGRAPRGLVLVPTRELANQVLAAILPLANAAQLRATVIFGGVAQSRQAKALADGVDIVVACPGRLEDLVGQRLCDLSRIEVTILDEADHMADLGFLPAVKRILDRTPQRGQRMLFSATLDNGVDVLVRRYLTDPCTHSVAPAAAPVSTMEHHVLQVDKANKPSVVRHLASGTGRRVMFTRTKHEAKKLARALTAAGIPAVELQGNLSQAARERNLAAFMDGSVRVLCATDIAARGIHVDDVELVVHVDPPADHKAYLHRSGRTARAGASGVVVTVSTPDQRSEVASLTRQARIAPQTRSVAPGDAVLTALVGVAAELKFPTEPPAGFAASQQSQPARATAPRQQGTGPVQRSRTAAGFSGSGPAAGGGRRRGGRGGRSGRPAAGSARP